MIRTILSIAAVLMLCVTLGGCGGGGDGYDDAPEGGARRPAPENQRPAPGPDMQGESGLGTGGTGEDGG